VPLWRYKRPDIALPKAQDTISTLHTDTHMCVMKPMWKQVQVRMLRK
jgi:hypothetical protein